MPIEEKILPEDQRAAKLRSILAGVESLPGSRPVTSRNQRQRLERVRTEIINLVNKEFATLCCCRLITVGFSNNPDGFEGEMNRPCVVHGRRNLGQIVTFTGTPRKQGDLRLLELVRQYRLRQYRQG